MKALVIEKHETILQTMNFTEKQQNFKVYGKKI